MKRSVAIILCLIFLVSFSLAGCGNTKVIDGVEYDTYGLLNQDDKKNPNIRYEMIWGNVVWGTVFVETIIVSVYFFGFSLFEPVGKKCEVKGCVSK